MTATHLPTSSPSSKAHLAPGFLVKAVNNPEMLRRDHHSIPDGSPAQAGSTATRQPTTSILIGIDDRGRPHGSRFDGSDPKTIKAAADVMGFEVLPVTSEAMAELASRLPAGKLFASGKAFVPFVGRAMFDRLVAYLPISARPLQPAASNKAKAGAAASTSGGKNTAADGNSTPKQPGNVYAAVKEGSAKPRSGMFPDDWDKIRVGQIVLATADRDEGWWTAHVREDKGDGVYVLEWEEWADFDLFIRRREQIALLHPAYDGK